MRQTWRLPIIAVLWASSSAVAFAQGNDASTSGQQGQTSGHPPPLLSTIEVTSVPSSKAEPTQPLAPQWRRGGASPFGAPPFRLEAQSAFACDAIADETARTRCSARTAAVAPPMGQGEQPDAGPLQPAGKPSP